MNIIRINGRKSETREDFYRYLKHKLDLPAYCGSNLDALADCLPEACQGRELILTNAKELKENLGDYADGIITVFTETAADSGCFTFAAEE